MNMDNDIECIRNDINTNLDFNVPNIDIIENVETPEKEEEAIKPSIWTLQEVLHFGYHPPKKLKIEELEVIYNEDKKHLIWLAVCGILCFLDKFTDILFVAFLVGHGLSVWLPHKLVFGGIIFLIIIIPSVISNLTNPTAIWRSKEYNDWYLWKRCLWWIGFPFYFLFDLEILFQYYKNFINLKNYISHRSGNRNLRGEGLIDDEPDQLLKEYSDGVFTVARLGWLHSCLESVPILLFYMFLLYSREQKENPLLAFICATSVVGVWLSNYKFTKAFYVTRGQNHRYFIFASSLCSTVITIFRIMLIEDIMLYILISIIHNTFFYNEGWFKIIILTTLIAGHWLYETVRWRLSAPEGFKGFFYTIYAGIYRTSVPDSTNFVRCIESNAIMMIEASFMYVGARFVNIVVGRWKYVVRLLVSINHYLVVVLLLAHFGHIILYYVYKKKIVKNNKDQAK